MKARIFLATIAVIIAAGCKKEENKAKPELKTLTEAVYASGNVYPKEEYLVFANADGILENILAEAGDSVSEGQVLYRIESDVQSARQSSAFEIYETVKKNNKADSPILTEASSRVNSAKAKLENDSINFNRFKNLLAGNSIAKSEYDKAALAYSVSKNDYQASLNSFENLKRQLFIELQQAENQYRVSFKEKNNYIISAQINGLVYELYKERGEAIRKNEPIALLGNHRHFVLRLNVDEQDISKVKIGQEVLVKLDLEKDKIWMAKITKIHPKLNVKDQSFRVDAEFTGEKPVLYYGITVEANIVVQTKENVLTIPKNTLVAADSVWVVTPSGEEKIKIRKGIEDFDYVEVLSGITKETELLIK